MEIHTAKADQLRQRIRTALNNVQVLHSRWVVRASMWGFLAADELMGKHGDNQRDLAHFIDDSYPVLELAQGSINAMLAHNEHVADATPQALWSIPQFADLDAVASNIVNLIQALPLRYTFSVELPVNLLADYPPGFTIHLTERMSIRNAGGSRDAVLPLSTGNKVYDMWVFNRSVLTADTVDAWKGAILEIQDEGYVTKGVSTSPRLRAVEASHSVIGLAMVFGMLQRRGQYTFMPTSPYYVHVNHGASSFPLDKSELSSAASALVADLTAPPLNIDEQSKKIREGQVIDFFWNLRAIFDNASDSQRIQNAAKWYFDAEAASDPLLGFVQMMVVLEILYGDKELSDKIGLGELLRNRCAYAIGQGAADRDDIIRDFKSIYDVRSAIVHRGKNRLSGKERALFGILSAFCRRAIFHEAQMLRKDFHAREAMQAQAQAQQGSLFSEMA
ncbi:hypothetical protein [Brevundimonas naejangsanensis]|uniref:hypothetical protein n=1 Tax=Brevundimonas naejangsanensis TaxID=588932 RepID=UPI003D0730F4